MIGFFKRLLRTFVKELKNIIIALLIAIAVWFAISMQIFPDIVSRISDIPVTVTPTEYMTENNLSISDEYEKTVAAQISGKRYDIGNLSGEDFTAALDLSNVTGAGKYAVGVDITSVNNVACEIEDSSITVNITVEKIVSKTFSVTDGTLVPTADGVLPTDDMKIDEISVQPSFVILTGDSAALDQVEKVEVKCEYSGEASSSITSSGEVVLLGANGEIIRNDNIQMDNDSFTVGVSLYKQKTLPLTVQFTNVPDNFDLDSLKYSIYPETLTVSSPDGSVDLQDKFEVGTIDLSQLTTKYLQRLTLPVTLPEGYKNVSGNTSAMVTFEADDYTFLSFVIPKENIIVRNAPDDYTVDILTNEITVNVTGPSADLIALTSQNIYATVDLMGTTLTEGLKDVNAEFNVRGAKTSCWVTGEYKVSIEVSKKTATESN